MKQLVHLLSDLESFKQYLGSDEVSGCRATSRACLAQVYSMPDNPSLAAQIAAEIAGSLPGTIVVGASTVGEVAAGRTMTGSTLIILSFFEATRLHVLAGECARGGEYELGQQLAQALGAGSSSFAGILLLATPLSLDVNPLLKGIGQILGTVPVFGGGAGDYAAMNCSWILMGDKTMDQGCIAVALDGSELHIETRTSLGWHPLSKEMQITSVDGLKVLTIDNMPAFDVYRRYIQTEREAEFALTASEFPFLIERNGETFARVPIDTAEDNALLFMADIAAGDRFRIGYGDPARMLETADGIHRFMREFKPQGILVFVCGCRRYLLQEDAELETWPFELSAPTAGFYTYGEFHGHGETLGLLNATLLAVGMREGPPSDALHSRGEAPGPAGKLPSAAVRDPYARQHARVVSSLVRFIDTVTAELEAANRQLARYSSHLEALVDERTAALSIAKEAAEAGSRAKSIFVANLSHELRTPLNGVLGMTDLARRRTVDPKTLNYLDKTSLCARNLLTLINDLLDIANIEGARLTLEKSAFQLGEVMKNLDLLSREKAMLKGLSFAIDIDEQLSQQVFEGDPLRLSQVLLNLTGNAVKFTPSGHIHIRVRLAAETSTEAQLRFSVQDTGIGIPAEDKQRLFRLFEQGDGSASRKYGGTGLGLTLSKRLVEMMGGEISVISEPGQGSTFWFSIKLSKPGLGTLPAGIAISLPSADAATVFDDAGGRRPVTDVVLPDNPADDERLVLAIRELKTLIDLGDLDAFDKLEENSALFRSVSPIMYRRILMALKQYDFGEASSALDSLSLARENQSKH